MPFRTWMYVFAIIGLTLPALGQTEEEAQPEQGKTSQQQQPAQNLPLPFPVEIIEDQAETDARKGREEEALRNEIADLAAQEGMNAATQAIKDATLNMRDYAHTSTILVGLGTFLAFAAFVLSLLANRSAREAVSVMRDEQRPWLQFGAHAASPIAADKMEIYISLSNRGASPARNVEMAVLKGELLGTKLTQSGDSLSLASVIYPNDASPPTRHIVGIDGSGPWHVACMAKYKLPNGDAGTTQTNYDVSRNGKVLEIKEMPGGDTT